MRILALPLVSLALLAACARSAHPAGSATLSGSGYDPARGCCGARSELAASLRQADFLVAQLDAQGADWSVYAHHPNEYLRGLSLLRLRERTGQATDAQLRRVAELLVDGTPLFSAHCAELLGSCEQGQGLDMERGICQQNAQRVGRLADDVLARAAPERAIQAIVSYLSEPGLDELAQRLIAEDSWPPFDRLRAAAAAAPHALNDAIAERLPNAGSAARERLLLALCLAPLGSGDPRLVSAAAAAMKSKEALEAELAAAAILRLTDGAAATAASEDLRSAAIALLTPQVLSGGGNHALVTIGPAAFPLLEPALVRVRRAQGDPLYVQSAMNDVRLIAAIGPRALSVQDALFELAAAIAARKGASDDYALAELLRALGAIAAPAARLTPLALAHAGTQELFAAATSALLAVHAKLSADELARLEASGREQCHVPNHPRAFDGSWDVCLRANADLEALARISRGEPAAP